ncbi:MAG: efflux RND transporter permease subunit [Vicinamibacteria bacterium]|nr:efflux RND transporter permease subunit [Vicinamibacteria bacterium]
MPRLTDDERIRSTRNTSRYFVEHRQVAWAALIGVFVWGVFGYRAMPQRKDPEIPVRVAVASCLWPGASAQEVEQLITRPIERTIAQNKTVHPVGPAAFGIRSISLPGSSFVYVQLSEQTDDSRTQFSDINLKLSALNGQLPAGAGTIQFQSDFGDTAAIMMTVASPPVDDLELEMRARSVEDAIKTVRASSATRLPPVSLVYAYPLSLSEAAVAEVTEDFRRRAEDARMLEGARVITGRGFSGVNGGTSYDDARLLEFLKRYIDTRLQASEFDPDVSPPVIIRDVSETRARLATAAGSKYSYAQLDNFTDLISRALLGVPETSRAERKGVLPQAVYLDYSQERMAAYGFQEGDLGRLLNARNITLPGGSIEAGGREVQLDPSGRFDSVRAIGDVVVGAAGPGAPVYLRDLVKISRGYQTPARYLNFYSWTDSKGAIQRSRAITLAVYMRSGEQIQKFGASVDLKLAQVRAALPPDLIIARTSDQPTQVRESIQLFMQALYEAIALVVLIALVGFWEWRSALLMAISMPVTLAMTFGMVHLLGVDLQQVSIATLIIALGLLVDDPVVANDAIKRDLSAGLHPRDAAWLGPTKLARAILYATLTNIIAYLPFLMIKGNTGDFLHSLPIVMTAALIASRIVSMTFIPLLGYYLLRAPRKAEPTLAERRQSGFYGAYYRLAQTAIERRWAVLALSLVFLIGGGLMATRLKTQFFPEDLQYWSYVDVWLPNDAPLSLTNETARQTEQTIRRVLNQFERSHPAGTSLLTSLTTFVGGGGPRFWFATSPEQQQRNYAQVLIQLSDKEVTARIVKPLQAALSAEVAGAHLTVHQLQTNPVEFPLEVRISGTSDVDPTREAEDIANLRRLAGEVQDIFSRARGVQVVQNDWFEESPEVKLKIDADRANLAGLTNRDVAMSAAGAINGTTVTAFREGNQQIPVIARLRAPERAQLSDLQNLYVFSGQSTQRLPLRSISRVQNVMETQRIRRQEHFRTIGIHAYPQPGVLPSEVLKALASRLREFERDLPPGYRMQIGGEKAKQEEGFDNLAVVLLVSMLGIYAALLLQFNNAIKPLLVFAATPYGVVGAILALWATGTPFGFMAFLGIASLIGVIVSHIIVLFDFIEEMHEAGEPFRQAMGDAGIERLRPVIITVGATILALFPLASHGGPLWKPLCYAQIGGLGVATFITLLLVPVFYSIAVLDLKIVKWRGESIS